MAANGRSGHQNASAANGSAVGGGARGWKSAPAYPHWIEKYHQNQASYEHTVFSIAR